MKFRKPIALLCLGLMVAPMGCDSRPNKPAPSIPKKVAQASKADDNWPTINREEVEAANRPKPYVPERSLVGDLNQPTPPAEPVTPTVPQQDKPTQPVQDNAGSVNWLDADGSQLPMEYWEVQYFNAQRIGITHYTIQAAERRGLKIRMETNMQFTRGDRAMRQSIVVETREQMDGSLEQFEETLTSGGISSTTNAVVSFKEMRMTTTIGDQSSKRQIPWADGSWGPMGIHQLLLRKPMRPGDVRQAKVFLPQMHQLATVTLVAGKVESTTSPDGLLADVVPIDVVMQLPKEGIRVRMWADASGRIQKTIWPEGLNLSSFRISKEAAQQLQAEVEIDSYLTAALPYNSTDAVPVKAEQVQYEIRSEQADPHELFSSESNQTAKSKSVYETLVTVYQPDWKSAPAGGPRQPTPSLKELSSNVWLPSESPQIGSLASQWAGQATEPIDVARALLQGAYAHLRKLEFAPTIRSVEMTAQSQEGDCTEHAMLLATLLRNRKIPARIASGVRLRPGNGQPKFEYHMWTEAWLNDHWVPMDATEGQLTSCAYIKFLDTSLADSDPHTAVLNVLRELKFLKIVEGR